PGAIIENVKTPRGDIFINVVLAPVLQLSDAPFAPTLPPLPAHHFQRDNLLNLLRSHLISGNQRAVALVGMGGIGKSVLAARLGMDDEIRNFFSRGLIWIRCGTTATPLAKQAELLLKLTGTSYAFRNVEEGRAYLEAVSHKLDRPVLLILDDIWDEEVAEAF